MADLNNETITPEVIKGLFYNMIVTLTKYASEEDVFESLEQAIDSYDLLDGREFQ